MKNWKEFLDQEKKEQYFIEIMNKVEQARKITDVYPKEEDMFSCFDLCPYEDIKVVILGQDPYHGENQAHGMSFSVKPNIKVPPSLKNIYKELESDLGIKPPSHGYLISWAKEGVLLMNTSWSVEAGKAASHKSFGWNKFTKKVLDVLNNYDKPLVFILWGNHAINAAKGITNPKHLLIKGIHPSPLAASGGFFGSKPFSQTNTFLEKEGRGAVNWEIPELDGSAPKTKPLKKPAKTKKEPKPKVQTKESEKKAINTEEDTEGMKIEIAENRYRLKENGKWFLINEKDEKLTKQGYDRICGLVKNFLRVKNNGLTGLINVDGEVLHKPEYSHISKYTTEMHEKGFQIFTKNGIGFMNSKGKEIIPPKFYEYKIIGDNCYLAKMKSYGDTAVYDKNGNEIIPPVYHRIEDAGNGYFKIYSKTGKAFDYAYALFSPSGEQLTEFKYGDMGQFYNGFIRARLSPKYVMDSPGVQMQNPDRQWTFLDENGKEITDVIFDDTGDFEDSLAPVCIDKKVGFLNTKGELVIDYKYQQYVNMGFDGGLCRVGDENDRMGVINTKGETVIPFEYNVISKFKNGVAFALLGDDGDDFLYIDINNNKYYPKFLQKENKWVCVDSDDNIAENIEINMEREIIEDSINFSFEGKVGFRDSKGKVFIEPVYDETSAFFWGGIAAAQLNGKWGFINRKNEVIVPFEYENAGFIMKGYGVVQKEDESVMLVGENGLFTEDSFVRIGYDYKKYNKEKGKWQNSPGGKWLWNIFRSEWQFYDLIDKNRISAGSYGEFSYLKNSVDYERDYFEVSLKDEDRERYEFAVIADNGEIIFPKNIKDDIVFLEKGQKYDFNRIPNDFLLEVKIKGVKAKMNENFSRAFDDYYLNDHHSKVYEYTGGLQNNFYVSLSAAIFEWIFWRTYETVSPYMNMEIVFQKIEALYAFTYSIEKIDRPKMSHDIGYYSDKAEQLGLSEKEKLEIGAVDDIIYYIEKLTRRHYNGSNIVSVVVFARLVLSGAKKKLFNEWLDMVLEKARLHFEIDFYPSWFKAYYDFSTDDIVPREFFFDKDYNYTPESGERLMKEFVEKLQKDKNYFLL